MNLKTNDAFIEHCAREYFNGQASNGVPFHQSLTFEQFVNLKASNLWEG